MFFISLSLSVCLSRSLSFLLAPSLPLSSLRFPLSLALSYIRAQDSRSTCLDARPNLAMQQPEPIDFGSAIFVGEAVLISLLVHQPRPALSLNDSRSVFNRRWDYLARSCPSSTLVTSPAYAPQRHILVFLDNPADTASTQRTRHHPVDTADSVFVSEAMYTVMLTTSLTRTRTAHRGPHNPTPGSSLSIVADAMSSFSQRYCALWESDQDSVGVFSDSRHLLVHF